jgi:predicted small metal-binding protein
VRVTDDAAKPEFYYRLQCPCGTSLRGDTEDEIVETSFAHLRDAHPDMADEYEREHILFMAQKFVKKA